MTAPSLTDSGHVVRPRRQVLLGLVLLVVGCLAFLGLVAAGTTVLSSVGVVLAVAGLALIVNGAVLARRGGDEHPPVLEEGVDRTAVVALALAVLLPPAGVLVASYAPTGLRRGSGLGTVALVLGTILTILYTLLIVMFSALGVSGG
jgi:hypothetical protein